MNRLAIYTGLLVLVVSPLFGQQSRVVGQHEARQLSLQRMWYAQAALDPGRSRLLHLTQHVSASKSVTIYQIEFDGGRVPPISERDVDRFGTVIGPEKAKKAAQIKFNDLTNLKLNPKLQTIIVPQITLYGVTESALVQAIDAETGRTLWKTTVGKPGVLSEAVGCSDLYVAVVSGTDLYLLKAENGEFIWKRGVAGAPGAGPAITSHLIFVPMINGAMEAYEIDDTKLPPSIFKSQGRALWQPVYTGTNVAWPTDRGHLYVTGAIQNRINFRLEANNAIASPATVMAPGKLLVSSVDGFVYCLQEANGVVLWRFSTGEPILETPVVFGDTVYTVTSDGHLFAINAELGTERDEGSWPASGVSKILSASPTRLYCLDSVGGLVVVDRHTGSRLGSLAVNSFDLSLVNKQTDRIVLADSRGTIQCLREIQQEFPMIYVSLKKPDETPAKSVKKPTKGAEAPKDTTTDPFGTGATTPETKAEEKPAAKDAGEKKVDDPFGM